MTGKPIYKITIGRDRSTAAARALLLLVWAASAILETHRLFFGEVTRVSHNTLVMALGFLVLAIHLRELLLTLAFALIGIQASARIALNYVHASYPLRHFAGISGMTLAIVACVLVTFAIAKWLRSAIRRIPMPEPEDPTP